MAERETRALKAIRIAMLVNTLIALIKVVLGVFGNSISLISDGIDTTIDIVKNIIVYKGTEIASRPPDSGHPYGHGRAETISSSIIGISVILAGFFIIFEGISKFNKTEAIESLMIIGASISIIGKIFLSSYMSVVGKNTSNEALIANAKDYFGDILASSSVLIGGLLIRITNKAFFDSIASFFVSGAIIYMGFDILKPAVIEIMETSDENIAQKVEDKIKGFDMICNPHQIRVRKLGSYYIVDLHIELPKDMSVFESHRIATEIENKVKNSIDSIYEVVIHIEPCLK
ncbi:MAG: cation diffusion facilitator family transporter [Caldisericaceae bacterium]